MNSSQAGFAKRKIFFRADGNARVGLGHVMRCIALAEMLKDDFDCHFIIRNPPLNLKQQILSVFQSLIQLPDTENDEKEALNLAQSCLTGNEIVVLDGYHFRTEYQKIIKQKGNKLVCIDDIHNYHFVADVIINHIGGISAKQYSKEAYTNLFLGPEYSLIRKEFFQNKKKNKWAEKNSFNCLLCMGGGDPNNCTHSILNYLIKIDNIGRIDVVTGASYMYLNELNNFLKGADRKEVLVHNNIKSLKIIKLLKNADFGIFPASTIALEAQALSLPMMLGYYVENQIEAYRFWVEGNYAVGLGDLNYINLNSINTALSNLKSLKPFDLPNVISNILEIFKEL